jgi:hypothetical protein
MATGQEGDMPVHDWARVDDGTFHDFHVGWTVAIRTALNRGILPRGYYAQAEQMAGNIGPDVLTLQRSGLGNGSERSPAGEAEGATVATLAPPRTSLTFRTEISEYTARQRSLIIRHARNHRIIALIEVLSAGNKASEYAFQTLIDKVLGALAQGIHVLLVDLHPPTPRDPEGIHAAVWQALHAGTITAPADRRLTLASYEAGAIKNAYVEPLAVGMTLPAMPLYLWRGFYVLVPLEETYQAAWEGVPELFREILEQPPN